MVALSSLCVFVVSHPFWRVFGIYLLLSYSTYQKLYMTSVAYEAGTVTLPEQLVSLLSAGACVLPWEFFAEIMACVCKCSKWNLVPNSIFGKRYYKAVVLHYFSCKILSLEYMSGGIRGLVT